MTELRRLIRKTMIRWQLRSLDQQVEHIVEARNHALARLIEIQRKRDIKWIELCDFADIPMPGNLRRH